MASSKEYLQFLLKQLSGLEGVRYRAMMGEYVLYYRDKVVGGIYDNCLLVKPVESAKLYLPVVIYKQPYEGAKDMLLIENVDDAAFLCGLIEEMYEELPMPKPKSQRKKRVKNIV